MHKPCSFLQQAARLFILKKAVPKVSLSDSFQEQPFLLFITLPYVDQRKGIYCTKASIAS